METTREFDVILWGATGFTGRLCFEYLAKKYPFGRPLKWAIAGRSQTKLKELKTEVANSTSVNLDQIQILVGDIKDSGSIQRIASRTKVIMSTAGPFSQIGTPIVDACVKSSTNYVDITGEPPWIREIIDKYHNIAVEKRIKIIPCCGFDCIPVDMGCRFLVDDMIRRGINPQEVRMVLSKTKGDASGGTIASVFGIFEKATISSLLAGLNPFFLCPKDSNGVLDQPTSSSTRSRAADKVIFDYDSILKMWCMPFLMQTIDTRVVNRSNALTKWRYGKEFIYTERMKAPLWVGILSTIFTPLIATLLFFSVTRNILRLFLPSSGQGPSEQVRETGYFFFHMWGRGVNQQGNEVIVKGRIDAPDGDPGYKQTAVMVIESAICLSENCYEEGREEKNQDKELFGVLTPSTGLGPLLYPRLEQANIKFKIDS